MIDKEKTDFLRKRLQQEKTGTESQLTDSAKGSNSLSFLLIVIARYFAFYGMQWLILTKMATAPFSMLETIIIYFGIISIFANKK
jgi:hypothetical protein